jgi:nicotinamide-nucleotide amidase
MLKAAILTIGDEILIGQILNSNTQWISERFTELGIEVTRHLTVGDKPGEILGALRALVSEIDVLIVGGGLGPTHDDITMEMLSQFLKTPLEHDPEWMRQVEAVFKARKRGMPESNKKQALLLKGARRIDNDCGTAAGQHITDGRTEIFVVPGVPFEMKSMMERYILPYLTSRTLGTGEKIRKATLLTTGVGESALAERLKDFVGSVQADPRMSLAFLPSPIMVRLRLQMKTSNPEDEARFEALASDLRSRCGQDFFGMDPATLEEILVHTLLQGRRSLAVAESCTGGMIAHRLTSIPGASEVLRGSLVAYQAEVKTRELAISQEFLAAHGVVSEATAKAMAEEIRAKWSADYGLATTGYLGPGGGDAFATVGTVWIGLATPGGTFAREFRYEVNRERGKERAAQSALDLLRRNL